MAGAYDLPRKVEEIAEAMQAKGYVVVRGKQQLQISHGGRKVVAGTPGTNIGLCPRSSLKVTALS